MVALRGWAWRGSGTPKTVRARLSKCESAGTSTNVLIQGLGD